MWKRLIRIAQPVFLLLAFILIGFILANQWEELRFVSWQLDPKWLAVATLFLLGSWAVEVLIWCRILVQLGGRLPYLTAVRIWFLAAVVRYIPGNIWQPLSMTLRCQKFGVRPEATLTSVLLYQAVILLAASPIAILYFGLSSNYGLLNDWLSGIGPWLLVCGALPVVIFLLRADLLLSILNWLLRMLKRPALDAELSSANLLSLLCMAIVDWILWGISFAALTFALGDYSVAQLGTLTPHLIASYPIAYAIGFLSLITPSGFGVREGALYLLLSPILGAGVVTVAALAMRLWTTLGELIVAGVCAIFELNLRHS